MKQVVCLFLLVSIISNCLLISVEADDEDRNAFSDKINECLFNDWKQGGTPILASKVDCSGGKRSGLCYGINNTALFAVCYNSQTLIPEFSGHVVIGDPSASGRGDWVNDKGKFAPKPQADTKQDYEKFQQKDIVPNFDYKTNFYSRGHLTPNNIFDTDDKREITMIITNAAPQWQVFNSQNWAVVEKAVRTYSASNKQRPVYVVTGTCGTLLDKNGHTLLLNKRVVAPGYYWKAVCDPVANQSEVLVAANPTGDSGTGKEYGCDINQKPQKPQTRDRGIVNCYSLDELKKRPEAKYFNLPNFAAICNPQTRGTFLDPYLKKLS
ncbi:uncharacterized protein LOC114535923 isoform X2 [Dendronephthya gigantea]|uniref:uncharacterized protein LOC114535923 isoform X2 n=1 Tax=Dendronephthya gigantea TaxID=151771 RepID=UPI00106C9A6F|nr:uncharacterized protein LOC114535923 isoform X2 [Dendronephthya gigantea]XP_028413079.1 uncharacterized protein LOC114535923 isoform X2 [Dendronephthya gigantea]XP_028413084.1 uncharacterized protein LOC114535923 isoform X2 [Dendronephthya gigantea]